VPALTVLVLRSTGREASWRLILVAALLYAVALVFLGERWEQGLLRQTLLGQNPIWAARAVLTGAIVAVLGPFPLGLKVVTTPFLVYAGAITLSLGPLVGMVLGVMAGLMVIAIGVDRRDQRGRLAVPLLAIAMGVVAIAVLSGALESVLAPLGADRNVTARSDYLEASVPMFLADPLFGRGIGGFSVSGIDLYPHNLPAEVAVELGVVGLLVLGVWGLMALRGAAGSPLLVGLVVGSGAYTLFSGSLASQSEFWMFSALAVAAGGIPTAAPRPSRMTVPAGRTRPLGQAELPRQAGERA
jgi:O-antigen ligase